MATIVKELLVKFGGDAKGLEAASNNAKKAVGGVATETRKASVATTALMNSLRPLLTVYAALKAVGIADEFALLESRVTNATRSAEEAQIAWEGLKNISRETGTEVGATVEVFQRLSFVRDEIKASTSDMLKFTDTVSKLGVVSGASSGALRAGLTQLGQSLSSQIVRAEEFNSIMENIPAVGKAIADQFGVTTGQLRQLVIEGEVLSEDVFAAILAQSEKANAQFEKFPMTVSRAFQELKVRMAEAIGGVNETTNATKILIATMGIAGKAITAIANLISGFANVLKGLFDGVIASILIGFNNVMKGLESVVNFAIESINKVTRSNIEPIKLTFDAELEDALAQEGIRMGMEKVKKAGEDFAAAFEDVANIFGVNFDESERLTQSLNRQGESTDNLSKNYKKLAENLKGNTKEAKEAAKAMEKLRKEQQEAANKMADSFIKIKDGFKGSGSMAEKFRNVVLNVIDDVANNLIRLSFGGTSQGGLGGGIAESIFSGFGGVVKSVSSGIGGWVKGLFGFANGGSFTVGGDGATDSGIVAFKATRGEQVTVTKPGQTAQMGGGGSSVSIVQNISIGAGVSGTVRNEIAKLLPDLKRAAVEGVADARLRGAQI